MARKLSPDKILNIFSKYSNPLRYLNNDRIESMLQTARYGNDVVLQLAYSEMEKETPIFSACINKRIAGVQSRKWDIVPIDDSNDAKLQAEQIKKVFEEADNSVEDNLTDAIRHLTLASFRGRAAIKPFIVDGKLVLKRLHNWNFVRHNNVNYWNPQNEIGFYDANMDKLDLQTIPSDEICYVVDDKPLDWIGITIYLRQLVGETAWARFVEKQGIPQVIITVPEGTPETDLEKWNYRAQAIYEGGSGAMPFGSEATELVGARGQDPFTSFITHQSEMFCILAVGGTMDTLGGTQGASGAGLGSDVASKQNEQFQALVNYDCKRIQNALQLAVGKVAKEVFGQKPLCKFAYVESDDTTPKEYLELAKQCQDLGLKVDIEKLKELTGLQFISDEEKDVWIPKGEND